MAARNIQIRGLEPPDFDLYPASERKAYWTRVGEIAIQVKRGEVLRGIGADGKRLIRVNPKSRPDGAKGPALVPHYAESRTLRLLAMRSTEKGVTLYWHSGHSRKQKLPWATILGFHADGLVIGAYVRNTIGISPAGMRKIEAEAIQWWTNRRKNRWIIDAMVHRVPFPNPGQPARLKPPMPLKPKVAKQHRDATGREFDPADQEGMHAWTMAGFGAWGKGLTKAEREAIDSYSAGGYKRTNGLLRGTWWMREEGKPEFHERIRQIDKAIEKGRIPENVVVWRGIDPKAMGIDDPAKLAGVRITDKGFLSTSLSRDVAESETFSKGVLLKIKVLKGSHAASIEAAVGFGREREILLPRDGTIRVTKVTRTAAGQHVVEGEWEPKWTADSSGAKGKPPSPSVPSVPTNRPPARPVRRSPAASPPPSSRTVPTTAGPIPAIMASVSSKLPANLIRKPKPAPVAYLSPGKAPKAKSKRIQVYEE